MKDVVEVLDFNSAQQRIREIGDLQGAFCREREDIFHPLLPVEGAWGSVTGFRLGQQ